MKQQPKTEITKLDIRIAGKMFSLTLQEARELQSVLNAAFPQIPYWPTWIMGSGIGGYSNIPNIPNRWETTCGSLQQLSNNQ